MSDSKRDSGTMGTMLIVFKYWWVANRYGQDGGLCSPNSTEVGRGSNWNFRRGYYVSTYLTLVSLYVEFADLILLLALLGEIGMTPCLDCIDTVAGNLQSKSSNNSRPFLLRNL
jgi:hypothetical protein